MTAGIGYFFDIYKDLKPGRSSNTRGWQDRVAAGQVIKEAVHRVGGAVDADG
jgi:inorganic pyrophosphatase